MPPKVRKIRPLTDGQKYRLRTLRKIARMLDSSLSLPGSSYRIGLDPILGLVPGLGDLISPVFTFGIIWQGRDLGIPRAVQLRMVMNVAIDTLVGMVPIVGDLFDFAWKANDMNMTLLEKYAYQERRASAADWVFVLAMIALLVVIAVVPFVGLYVMLDVARRIF